MPISLGEPGRRALAEERGTRQAVARSGRKSGMNPARDRPPDEIGLIASAAAVPLLVVDYTPILERFTGRSIEEIESLLSDDDELLVCLKLPRELASSPEWTRLYGVPDADLAPDLIARNFSVDAYPELRDNMISQFLAPFRGVTSIRSEHRAPTVAGDVMVRSHWKAPISMGKPDYSRIVIVDLDVTDLKETLLSLEEAIESKDRLIATIAHELRNPLSGVVGFTSILASEWGGLTDEVRQHMAKEIADQARDISALLDDFLTAAAGHTFRVEDVAVDLQSLVNGVDLTGVSMLVDPGVVVRGDALRIRQILRNLIRNARKHGGPKQVMRTTVKGAVVALQIADNGPGVPVDVGERLFEPFSHGPDPGSLGLGLAVSHTLAEAMSGDLRYRREDGWSIFELILRAA